MATIEKQLFKDFGKDGARRTLIHYWWAYKMLQQLFKTVCQFLIKLHSYLPCDPAIPLLNILQEK